MPDEIIRYKYLWIFKWFSFNIILLRVPFHLIYFLTARRSNLSAQHGNWSGIRISSTASFNGEREISFHHETCLCSLWRQLRRFKSWWVLIDRQTKFPQSITPLTHIDVTYICKVYVTTLCKFANTVILHH